METVYRQQLLEEIKNTQELIREFWTSYGDLAEFLAQSGFFDRFFGLRDLTLYIKQTMREETNMSAYNRLYGWQQTEKMLRYFREEGKAFRKWLEKYDLHLIEHVTGRGWHLMPNFRERLQWFKMLEQQIVRVIAVEPSNKWNCAYRVFFQTGIAGTSRQIKSIYFDASFNPGVYEVVVGGNPVGTVIPYWLNIQGWAEVNRAILYAVTTQALPRLKKLQNPVARH